VIIRIFVALLVFTYASYSFGDKPAPPSSYKIISSNQKYVFVMIAPLSIENDASNKLLWSVDWYRYGVEIANDGVHLISKGGMASEMEDAALTFYSNGSPIQSYSVNQLVKNKRKLQHTASHFFWEKDSLFDREKNRYYIETLDQRHFIFDVSSGSIVSSSK
jgi:hypothetical protein